MKRDPRTIVASIESGHAERRVDRIARAVVAAGVPANAVAEADANTEYFSNTVAGGNGLSNFTTVADGDSSVIFRYDKDGSGSCSIAFGILDGGEWGYSVYIGGEEVDSESFSTCESAWKALLANMGGIIRRMDRAVDAIAEGNGARGHVGQCSLSNVVDNTFAKNMVFSDMYDPSLTYQLDFTADADTVKAAMDDAVKAVYERLSANLDVRRSRQKPSMRVQLMNKGDLAYVKGVVKDCGFDIDGMAGGR